MKMKQKVGIIALFLGLLVGVNAFLYSQPVSALDFDANFDINKDCKEQFPDNAEAEMNCKTWQSSVKETCKSASGSDDATKEGCKSMGLYSGCVGDECCGDVKTSIIRGDLCGTNEGDAKTSTVFALLKGLLRIMTAGVGIAAVGGIAYGALLYTTAENKPEQTKKAIGIITNVVIGLVAYGLMGVLLNFLIPGGVFG